MRPAPPRRPTRPAPPRRPWRQRRAIRGERHDALPGAALPADGSWPSVLAEFGSRRLPGFPVQRVTAAPAAVLAHLDPARIVALRLLSLVVPAFALFASERHADSDFSASHCSPRKTWAPPRARSSARLRAQSSAGPWNTPNGGSVLSG